MERLRGRYRSRAGERPKPRIEGERQQMARSDYLRDLPRVGPGDYRRGTLLGSMIVAFGAIYALIAILVVVDDARGSLLFVIVMLVMAGFLPVPACY